VFSKAENPVTLNVKYEDDLVLLAKERAVLGVMIDNVTEIEEVMEWK
jgi:hypothetical protein